MPYFLVSDDKHLQFSLSGPEEVYLVGRAEDCDIRLDSRKVSRRHCCIAQVNDYLAIRDLASTNGIRINGREVFEGRLSNGDIVSIGPFRFRVVWQPENVGNKPRAEASVAPPGAAPIPPAASPAAKVNLPPNASPPAGQPNRQRNAGSMLEDSRLFKMLESDDPLLGGGHR